MFDDPSFVVTSIDPILGWGQVDPGYANITQHAGWAIPWMEVCWPNLLGARDPCNTTPNSFAQDDMGLAGGELWVNRTLWHANDAASYGVKGLLGLLWRTFETSPQLAALAAAGWEANFTTEGALFLPLFDVHMR